MKCPKCHADNADDNSFCVSCGETLTPTVKFNQANAPAPTEHYKNIQPPPPEDAPESVQTAFRTKPVRTPEFNSAIPFQPAQSAPPKSRTGLWVGVAFLTLLLIAGAGIGGYFLLNKQTAAKSENLPDHLGMFAQNKNGDILEISRQDFSSALQAKDSLTKSDALAEVEDKPNLLLYSDGKDIPLGDLKLIQVDSIKDDGTLRQINFQAAPIEGKPDIKRLRVPEGLANGKYAFALFDGFLDEGKHKFWAFQVKNAQKTDNGDLAKAFTLSLKPKTAAPPPPVNANIATNLSVAPTPKPAPSVPQGSSVAYCKSNNIIVRSSPNLNGKKTNALKRGQKIYIINYSENYDQWKGMEGNWAYIQTENGNRGWVFAPLIGNDDDDD